MRILHTSDWHVGRNLHGVSLTDAHAAYFDHLVELVRSESIDAVLVSGDVYDRAVPPLESVELLSDVLNRLAGLTRVVLTSGNHDSAARLGFAAGLLREEVAIRSVPAQVGTPVALPAASGEEGILVYALPYLDPDMTRRTLAEGEEALERSHTAVVSAAMRRVSADLAARRTDTRIPAIVMAHAFVTGGEPSESERDLRVGGIGDVPAGAFGTEIDYLALGHLHGPQQVRASVPARYSGSPVAFSFSERNHVKSSVIVDVRDSGVRTELVEAPVLRRLVEVRGTLGEILAAPPEDAREAWVKAVVTDTLRPERMREQILERYPHAIVTLHQPALQPGAIEGVIPGATDAYDVLDAFVIQVTGEAPTAQERDILQSAYETARGA